MSFAQMSGAVDGTLGAENAAQCDLILAASVRRRPLRSSQGWRRTLAKKPVVIDCCGTKRVVCEALFPVAEQYGFTYLGGHPMAGSHHSGFKYARENLYHNAPWCWFRRHLHDIAAFEARQGVLAPAGFADISPSQRRRHMMK